MEEKEEKEEKQEKEKKEKTVREEIGKTGKGEKEEKEEKQEKEKKEKTVQEEIGKTGKGEKEEKEGTHKAKGKSLERTTKIIIEEERKEVRKTERILEMMMKRKAEIVKVWMPQLTTSFGALTFH